MDTRTAALIVSAIGIMVGAAFMYRGWKAHADEGRLLIGACLTLTQIIVFFLALCS